MAQVAPMKRPSRRCAEIAQACAVKVCVACKRAPVRGHADDAYHCREILGHVAPNWDAPGASSFFTEDAKPEEVRAWADLEAVPVQRKKKPVPQKRRSHSPKFGTPSHKRSRLPTGAMSDLPSSDPGAAAAAAPRGDFGLRKPLVFGEVVQLDATKDTTSLRAKELRRAGTPCVLTGVEARDVAPFAGRWLREDGSLDDNAFVRDVGNERAPILRYDATYTDQAPIREAMRVSEFVEKHWRAQDSSAYLHQWQFPLSSPEAFRKLLSDPPSENLPGLDDDLLDHWLERCRGRSALQYLFMGGVGTRSRLHVDPGGLILIIAPLVGWKEVTLVHRDDAELVGAMCSDSAQEVERGKRTPLDELLANETPPSLEEEPILSLVRCWRHVLKPGEVLIMPEGTLHAVRNVTPALSYHRFHLDTTNPAGFWRALVDGDCPGIRPAEILWNGAHGAMTALDNAVDVGDREDAVDRAECLLKLRHLVGAIVREFSESDQRGLGQRGDSVNSFDWRALLADADDALGLWAGGGGQRKNVSAAPSQKSRKVEGDVGASPRDSLYEPSIGDVVAVRFHAKQVRARVVDVASPSKPPRFCRVHYATYGSKYDELVECSSLRPRTDNQKLVVKVGARCKVPWGDSSDEYDAEVVALHSSAAVRLHYLTVGSDWDQWVGRRKIIRQLRA